MAFVNEYIPEEDFAKYDLHNLDMNYFPRLPGTIVKSRSWTIDRERNLFLRKYSAPRFLEDEPGTGWMFYWKGEMLWFAQEMINSKGVRNGPQWSHNRITKLKIPGNLKAHQAEILEDIREAFLAYAGGGVLSTATEYSQQIDFELE